MNILKAFKNNALALAATAATLLMGVGASAQVKQKADTAKTRAPVTNVKGQVIGFDEKGFYRAPTETSKSGDTTIQKNRTYQYRNMQSKDQSAVPGKTTTTFSWPKPTKEEDDRYNREWDELARKNNWTKAQLRQKQKEANDDFIRRMTKTTTTESSSVEKEKAKEIYVYEETIKILPGDTLREMTLSRVPALGLMPIENLDHGHVGGGYAQKIVPSENRFPYQKGGPFFTIETPNLFKSKLISFAGYAQYNKGIKTVDAIPDESRQGPEAREFPIDVHSGVTDRFDAQGVVRFGKKINFDLGKKTKQNPDEDLFEDSKQKIDLGRFEFHPFIAAGVDFATRDKFTPIPNTWDPAPTYEMRPSQYKAQQLVAAIGMVGFNFKVNLGNVKRHVRLEDGSKVSIAEAKELRAQDEAMMSADTLKVELDSTGAPKDKNAVELFQMKSNNMVSRLKTRGAKLEQKRTGPAFFLNATMAVDSREEANPNIINNTGSNKSPFMGQIRAGLVWNF